MSQENVEIVRNAFDAFARGDPEGLLRLADEEVVITQPVELPGATRQQRGHSGVMEAFAIWPEQWNDYRIDLSRIVAHPGDYVCRRDPPERARQAQRRRGGDRDDIPLHGPGQADR